MKYLTIEMTQNEIEEQILLLDHTPDHLISEAKLFLIRLLELIKFNKISKIAVSFYKGIASRDEVLFILKDGPKYLGSYAIPLKGVFN